MIRAVKNLYSTAPFRKLAGSILRNVPLAGAVIQKLGIVVPMASADRDFLESRILRSIAADPDVRNILFVGMAVYTWHYYKLLPGKNFYTIDNQPGKAVFGRKGFHIVGSVTELSRHYENEFFDVVIISGLIGYGLDTAQQVDQSLHEAFKVLKPGGQLILGWNDTPEHLGLDPETMPCHALFETAWPDALALANHKVLANAENGHTFSFLVKPLEEADTDQQDGEIPSSLMTSRKA